MATSEICIPIRSSVEHYQSNPNPNESGETIIPIQVWQKPFDKIATTGANILTENEDSIANTFLLGKPNSKNSFNINWEI